MKIAIIDDERGSRNLLASMIAKMEIGKVSISEYDSVNTAIAGLKKNEPDVALLDVNLGDGTGFDVLDNFGQRNFKVIFITGYDEYAIKAFKYSALDYLLKPINLMDLKLCFEKLKDSVIQPIQIETFKNNFLTQSPDSIIIPTIDGFEVIKIKDIIKIDASGSYSMVYSVGGKPKVVSKNLKYFEQLLPIDIFYRVHHGSIVNANYIKQYHQGSGGSLELEGNLKQAVSARKKFDFLSFFKKFIKK